MYTPTVDSHENFKLNSLKAQFSSTITELATNRCTYLQVCHLYLNHTYLRHSPLWSLCSRLQNDCWHTVGPLCWCPKICVYSLYFVCMWACMCVCVHVRMCACADVRMCGWYLLTGVGRPQEDVRWPALPHSTLFLGLSINTELGCWKSTWPLSSHSIRVARIYVAMSRVIVAVWLWLALMWVLEMWAQVLMLKKHALLPSEHYFSPQMVSK